MVVVRQQRGRCGGLFDFVLPLPPSIFLLVFYASSRFSNAFLFSYTSILYLVPSIVQDTDVPHFNFRVRILRRDFSLTRRDACEIQQGLAISCCSWNAPGLTRTSLAHF